jgi:hypothetical protein
MQDKVKRYITEKKLYPIDARPPLEYLSVKIHSQNYKFDEEFEAGNDFLDGFSFEIKNQSEKNIRFIIFNLFLYVDEKEHPPLAAFQLVHGTAPFPGGPVNYPTIKPGEMATISSGDKLFEDVMKITREKIKGHEAEIIRIGIYAQKVYFDDYTSWLFSGEIRPWKMGK